MIPDMVEALLRSVEGSSVTEVEYQFEGHRLRIVRDLHGGTRAASQVQPAQADAGSVPKVTGTAPAGAAALPSQSAVIVRAPMHGTFYRSSAPGEPPITEVGQTVEAGQQLALLEAMKMLHAVEAEEGGCIVKVLAENGALVEPGTPLFELALAEKAGV